MPTACICRTVCMLHDLWAWHPPVGTWIGVLGFLGVAVALVRDPKEISQGEKAIWIIVLFVLLGLELKTLYQDRDEHDAAERESRERSEQNFKGIAGGIESAIEQSQQEFNATMKQSDKELNGITRTLDTFTGSESYAYLSYVPRQGFLSFVHKGDYPLYGVTARIVDLDQIQQNLLGVVVSVGDMIKGHAAMHPIPNGLPLQGDHFNANVFFNARNGDWIETFRAHQTKDGWARAMRVEGRFTILKKAKPMCETVDRQFQLDSEGKVEKDWTPDPKLPHCQ